MFFISVGSEDVLAKLFRKGAPRFISPVPIDYDNPPTRDIVQEAQDRQLSLFKGDVKQQCLLSTIRSYLQLYKSMSLTKLASFLGLVSV